MTATRAERDVLEVPGNVTVIDREQIERSGLRDVPELLRRMAGVYVTNLTGSPDGYGMEIRGFNNGGGGGSSTLVLVDGRRINEPDSSPTSTGRACASTTSSASRVLRGPASAAWGDNAMGGVVQIFTRRGEGDTQATLKGHVGSYDNYGGSFYAGGSQGPVTASLFADGLDSDNYRDRSRLLERTGGGQRPRRARREPFGGRQRGIPRGRTRPARRAVPGADFDDARATRGQPGHRWATC